MQTGSLALYDAPPSSSPRLILMITAGTLAVTLALLVIVHRVDRSAPAAASSTPTVTAGR